MTRPAESDLRAAWIKEAADFISACLGAMPEGEQYAADRKFAQETAEAIADCQDGPVSEWDDPEQAALDEMEAWGE